jgi:hypothetical protein
MDHSTIFSADECTSLSKNGNSALSYFCFEHQYNIELFL